MSDPLLILNRMSVDSLTQLAQSQLGLVRRDQALAAGLTSRMIDGKLRRLEWERVVPCVYRVGGSPPGWHQDLFALQLWAGESAVSHRSAAALHGLKGIPEGAMDVTIQIPKRRPLPGARIFVRKLTPGSVMRKAPFVITSPTRTLIDLSAVLSRRQLELAVDDALRKGLTSVQRLCSEIRKGARGIGQLREILEPRLPGKALTESTFEQDVFQLIKDNGLPVPERQWTIRFEGRTFRLDLAYPQVKLAIECHGYSFHHLPQDWARDQWKLNALTVLGWRLIVVTWEDLHRDSSGVVLAISAALQGKFLEINPLTGG